MKTTIAKYPGTCRKCGFPIKPGQQINWFGRRQAEHADECPYADVPTYKLSGGEGYGYTGWTVDEVVRNSIHRIQNGEPEFLYILTASSEYVREDGMSFGVGDEQGYIFHAVAREATDEESVILRGEIARREEAKRKLQALEAMARRIQEEGERPEGDNSPEGVTVPIGKGQDIYGGGRWFVIGPEYVWFVQNNGADGDDWSRNNVRTGGAGAIGWRLRTMEELTEFFSDYIDEDLPTRIANKCREWLAEHIEMAPWAAEGLGLTAGLGDGIRSAHWVSLTDAISLGRLSDGSAYLLAVPGRDVCSYEEYEELRDTHGIWRHGVGHHDCFLFRFPCTPERDAIWNEHVPKWYHADRPGRYRLKCGFNSMAADRQAALRSAQGYHLESVEYTPDVTIEHVYRTKGIGHLIIWSDGMTFGSLWGQQEWPSQYPEAVSELLVLVMRDGTGYWRQDNRWREFLAVESYDKTLIKSRNVRRDEIKLFELTLRMQDGTTRTLWLVEGVWVDIGEDADVGYVYGLHNDRGEAERAYTEMFA